MFPPQINSHAVGAVVLMGASQHAVPPVCVLLDVLEEIRRAEDAEQGGSPRGEDLPQPGQQRKSAGIRPARPAGKEPLESI